MKNTIAARQMINAMIGAYENSLKEEVQTEETEQNNVFVVFYWDKNTSIQQVAGVFSTFEKAQEVVNELTDEDGFGWIDTTPYTIDENLWA